MDLNEQTQCMEQREQDPGKGWFKQGLDFFLLRMFLVNDLEKITEIQKVDYEKKPSIVPYAGMHFWYNEKMGHC